MEFMLANDWLQVINNAQQGENKETADPAAKKSEETKMDEDEETLKILDEESDDEFSDLISVDIEDDKNEKKGNDEEEKNKPIFGRQISMQGKIKGGCKCRKEDKSNWVPLIDHLCEKYSCTVKELQVLFCGIESRRQVIEHLKDEMLLKTTHLRPPAHNFIVRCCDITTQAATVVPALGGYLNVTVRAYYYVKHGLKLKHPYFPCIIQYGGGRHQSYFPLEVLQVAPRLGKNHSQE